jgi:hypothetical protein
MIGRTLQHYEITAELGSSAGCRRASPEIASPRFTPPA